MIAAATTKRKDAERRCDSLNLREIVRGISEAISPLERVATNLFEYDALKAAHRTAALITNPVGKPTNINLDTFVCAKGYAPHQRAIEILGALNRGFIPGSADRDSGAVPTFKILALPWIQSNTSYWFMFDSTKKGSQYGLQYKESQPTQLEGPNIVFKTGEIQYKATTMFDIGHNDARIWVGSKNTNAA